MPQIMAEAFARGLVDKIMVEVLDVIERDTQDGKSWEQHVDEETANAQSDSVHERSQTHEQHTHLNYNKGEEMELIAKIVRDLRDIQIGDSRYVLPPSLLALEKQVKCACSSDGAPLVDFADVAETRTTTQGQGDTHQTVHAVVESPVEPTESTRTIPKEKENEATEAASVSVGLLHHLIKDMEKKAVPTCSKDDPSADTTNRDCIANWEEKEEQFIRTIESTDNVLQITTEAPREDSASRHYVGLKRQDELKSHSSQCVVSTLREGRLEEIQLEGGKSGPLTTLKSSRETDAAMSTEEILSDDEARKTPGDATKKKKRGFGSRLRKFFRTTFGRQKN